MPLKSAVGWDEINNEEVAQSYSAKLINTILDLKKVCYCVYLDHYFISGQWPSSFLLGNYT